MLTYPNIDPLAFSIGPLKVHWYGLMYLIAFVTGWWLGYIRTRRVGTEWKAAEISDLLFYFALGAVLGGRIGYTLMYNFSGFIDDPVVIFRIWQGGMSYHGGMVGVFVAMWLYGRHTGRTFFQVYPQAEGTRLDDLPSAPGHCGVCHFAFGGAGPMLACFLARELGLPQLQEFYRETLRREVDVIDLRREEVTTEGGLDLTSAPGSLGEMIES